MPVSFDEKIYLDEQKRLLAEYSSKPSLNKSVLNNRESLVIIVDMINGFCKEGALSSDRCAGIISGIKDFLDLVPDAEKAFARDCHPESALEFKSFPVHCASASESALVDELKGYNGLDIPKNSTNAFFSLMKKQPNLALYTNIAVVGVCTDICVLQLALTLKAYFNEVNAPVNVMTFTGLTETYNSDTHNADLMNLYAYRIMEQAGVKIFKDII